MAKKKKELVVLNPEITGVIAAGKMDKTKAEVIAANYQPLMAKVVELSQYLKTVDLENPTDDQVKECRVKRLALVKVRTATNEQKAVDKSESLQVAGLVDGLVKVVLNTASLTESQYEKVEKFHEIKLAESRENLRIARSFLLEEYGTDVSYIPLGDITEQQFDDLLIREKSAKEARDIKAKQDEIDRENEAIRMAEEKRAREEQQAVELKKQKEENERLRVEQEKRNKEVEQERLKQQKIIDSQRAEQEKKDKEIQEFKDATAAAQKKIDDQVKAEAESKRLSEIAPDKEKINTMYLSLKSLELPTFASEEGKRIGRLVSDSIGLILTEIKNEAKKMK